MTAAKVKSLEKLMDRVGISELLEVVGDIAMNKRDHVLATWQDHGLAMRWEETADAVYKIAERTIWLQEA